MSTAYLQDRIAFP
jgi:hypothetical protein